MRIKNRIGILLAVTLSAFIVLLPACNATNTGNNTDANTDTNILQSELINPQYKLEFRDLAEGEVEIRQISDATQSLSGSTDYYVDFENEDMALMAPLSLLAQAEGKDSSIAMRYHYPEGTGSESITFSLPYLSEYEIYFPGVAEEDISLMVADVVVSEQQSAAIRSELAALGASTDEQSKVYATMVYLVDTSGNEPVALKLNSTEERIIMREEGSLDETALNARLYLGEEGDIYKPTATIYYHDEDTSGGFVDTYLFGSYKTTQGSLPTVTFGDIAGHYAEDAILQVQQSRNMASALTSATTDGLFRPDDSASVEDVLNAQGAFFSQPLMSERTYEQSASAIKDRYAVDQMFHYLINPESSLEVRSYVARVPYETAEVYEALGLDGKMEILMEQGLSLNSRISAALIGMGAFKDDALAFGWEGLLATDPSAEQVDTWLTGISDVAEDDLLRSSVALAVTYGLLSPNVEGELDIYAPISRGDLCLLYANLEELYAQAAAEAPVHDGYSPSFLTAADNALHVTIEGTWELVQATRADGSLYTEEQIEDEHASFVFNHGESTEYWADETYDTHYLFCAEERIITLYYANGEHEQLSFDKDLMTLTYHYVNEADPEFSGEVYVFSRVEASMVK